MAGLHESIMRLIVSAEVKGAVAGLKQFDQAVDNTAKNVSSTTNELKQGEQAVNSFGDAATTAKTAISGLATGLAIGAAIAVVGAIATAFVEVTEHIHAARDANNEFNLSLLQSKSNIDGILKQLEFEKKFIQAVDELQGKKGSASTQDEISNNNRQIAAEEANIKHLQQLKKNIVNDDRLSLDDINKLSGENFAQQVDAQNKIRELQQENILLEIKGQTEVKKETEDTGKKRLQILEQIKQAQDQLNKSDTRPLAQRLTQSSPGDIGQRVLGAKISEGIQAGIEDKDNKNLFGELVKTFNQQLQKLKFPDLHARILFDLGNEGALEDPGKAIEKQFKKLDKDAFSKLTIGGQDQEKVKNDRAETQKLYLEQISILGGAITGALEQVFEGVGEALGEAISGGGLSKAFESLGNLLSNALKTIGAAYIKTGTLALLAKTTFQKFLVDNPALSILAGIGLEAAASALKSQVSKTKAFGVGGIVTGPELAIVGEKGPEAIIPLDRLNQFAKQSQQKPGPDRLTTEISGQNLILVLNRAQKLNSLRGG